VHIEIQRALEALNERDDTATRTAFPCRPSTPDQRRFDGAGDDREYSGHGFRARRQQQRQWPGKREHPLSNRHRRQHVIDEAAFLFRPMRQQGSNVRANTRGRGLQRRFLIRREVCCKNECASKQLVWSDVSWSLLLLRGRTHTPAEPASRRASRGVSATRALPDGGWCVAVFVIDARLRSCVDPERDNHKTWRTRHEGQDKSQGWRVYLEQMIHRRRTPAH